MQNTSLSPLFRGRATQEINLSLVHICRRENLTKVELTNWVITPLVGYNIVNTGKSRLDNVGGARYLYLKADLRVDALEARAKDSGSNWDAVSGTRGSVDLFKK